MAEKYTAKHRFARIAPRKCRLVIWAGPRDWPSYLPRKNSTACVRSSRYDLTVSSEALCSSAHGAGRALSRTAARGKVTEREFRRQMEGVWFDSRLTGRLRDEAPSAYKDIRTVLRAQKELVKVTRTLRPVLNYKGV